MLNLVQVLVPLQDAAGRGADALGAVVGGVRKHAVSAAQFERQVAQNEALHHTVAALRTKIGALEQSVGELAGIRGRGMPGKLIPARVVAPDVSVWRESQLLDAGSLRSVRRNAAVVSDYFAVNLGTVEGGRMGQAVLAAEVFVGTIETTGTHTSRVKLVSDPTTRMGVLIARDQGKTFAALDERFWLVGAGGDHARIEDVDHRYIKDGRIHVGDWVLTVDGDERLPVSMVIGTITSIAPDPDNPLLFILDVKMALDPERLRRVYVVDPLGE
ncbi:MAG: rod shape-determining protein MreC [Planctomycetota bacterium]